MFQEQQQQQEPMYYAPQPDVMSKLGNSVLELTNPQRLVYEIKLNLEGYQYNHEGELYRDELTTPLLNEEGRRRVLGIIRSVVAQNSVMSHIESREDVNNIIMHLTDKLVTLLLMNRRTFGIKTREDASQILIYTLYPCWFTIMRCYKQGEKDFLKGSVQEIIQGNKTPQNKGLFKRLIGG